MESKHTQSQNAMILQALKSGNRITALDAFFNYGCLSLAQRIHNLREDGHPITSRFVRVHNGKRVAEYSLQTTAANV